MLRIEHFTKISDHPKGSIMELTEKQKAKVLDHLFSAYVQEHGLGGMSKTDFDALLLWLVMSEQKEKDVFTLSDQFKIKESRIKSLLEIAAVKFESTDPVTAWSEILQILSTAEFDVESLEKGQIRFPLRNPMLFRWIQDSVRKLNSTCSYNKQSEQVTLNLEVLYRLLDRIWDEKQLGEGWAGAIHSTAQKNIKTAIANVGKKIRGNSLEELRDMKRPKLRSAIKLGAELVGIGEFVSPLLTKIIAEQK
jgi:hypothetical protein